MERSEGDTSLTNPVTKTGIDAGTVRLVAQHLNHYATPGHTVVVIHSNFPSLAHPTSTYIFLIYKSNKELCYVRIVHVHIVVLYMRNLVTMHEINTDQTNTHDSVMSAHTSVFS